MKRIATILIVAAVSLPALAQGTAMDFIRADRNPVTAGLAGAGYASTAVGTAFSALANPAAVPFSGKTLDAAGSFISSPSGDSRAIYYGAGASVRLGRVGISAAYTGSSYPQVPLYSDGGGAAGTFKPVDMTAALGLSVGAGEYFSMGLVARYASASIAPKSTLTSFSADAMAMFRKDALSVCAGVVGLGPKVKSLGNKTYSLPASVKLAAAYGLGFGDFGIDLMADGDYYFSGNLSVAAGVQGNWKETAFLRAGYRYSGVKADFSAAPVPSGFSAGAGVKLFGVSLDVAYTLAGSLGGSLALGLGYSF